ncbi:hypothetical protein AMECASPLE_008041 [Ameca splendens]|uniref:Uncharacterized protein n=1 Tax=Ameca splendens TaxID=208324 RepID=A0ABV0ZKR4_9TELE
MIKLAASCCPPSPEPRQKRTLSTLQHKYLNIELTPELTSTHSSAQVKPSGLLRLAHLGPDSLYPWRPDGICLVSHFSDYRKYLTLFFATYQFPVSPVLFPSFNTVGEFTHSCPRLTGFK